MNAKERLAQELARRVVDGEIIGVGTGTTVDATLTAIGQRIRAEGLRVSAITTSLQSAWKCAEAGVQVLSAAVDCRPAWGFDGADAVDAALRAIKGKGGAMLMEKVIAARCPKFILAIDESKFVSDLAAAAAVPVEVLPEACGLAQRELEKLGAVSVTLRPAGTGKHGPVITEAGNIVLDAQFKAISADLESKIKQIVGVVDSGLFIGYAHEVLIGSASGIKSLHAGS